MPYAKKKHLLTRHRQMLSQYAVDWQVPQFSDKYFFQPPVIFFKFVGKLGQCWVKKATKSPEKPINEGVSGYRQLFILYTSIYILCPQGLFHPLSGMVFPSIPSGPDLFRVFCRRNVDMHTFTVLHRTCGSPRN